jgi:hypothetical protein
MATRPEHRDDFTVCTFDGGDPRGAINRAWRIAFREQLPAASPRNRKRNTAIADWRFAIRFEEQKHQIGVPNAALLATPPGMDTEPGTIRGIRDARCCRHCLAPRLDSRGTN